MEAGGWEAATDIVDVVPEVISAGGFACWLIKSTGLVVLPLCFFFEGFLEAADAEGE